MATRSNLDDFAYGLRSRHLEICEVLWEAIVEEGNGSVVGAELR